MLRTKSTISGGTSSVVRVRNTATPGVRGIFLSASSRRNCSTGSEPDTSFDRRRRTPERQVSMTVKTAKPSASGI